MANDLPEPIFISTDPAQIVADMKAFYEASTGKILQPAQPEMLVINALAYREALIRNSINEAAKQNLVQFSTAPVLDYLAQFVGVTRIPAQPAVCFIIFTLVSGHGALVMPPGIRVSSVDGAVVFATTQSVNIGVSDTSVTVLCECATPGINGNGYAAGLINTILDPQAYISAASNTGTTSGGADDETDDQLRLRIMLAPSAYSTAGSKGAYIYFAKSADLSIIDVEVTMPQPGTVNIYPLVSGGQLTSSAILAKVLAACSDEKVRPLTDTVAAISPSLVDYRIQADVTLYDDADQILTSQEINDALQAYTNSIQSKLGRDIVADKIMGLVTSNDGVYDAVITLSIKFVLFGVIHWLPVPSIILTETQFGVCNQLSVNIVGTNNG